MKISVVTVCLNCEATIGFALESFLNQSLHDKEMLIIDGLSTDGTRKVIESFPAPSIRVISEKDSGIYDAMNKGLTHFRGDAVGFLNADDRFHDTEALARLAHGLEQADAVYGDLNMVSQKDRKSVRRVWKAGPFRPGDFRKGWMPPHPTFYIRRELARRVGFFRTDFRISADYDFMLRALEVHGARACYIPHTLVDFTLGGRSTGGIGSVITGNRECLRVRQEHLHAPALDWALALKPLRKILQLR